METNRIYHGDCLEIMKNIPDGFIDLTVTSPPYDNLRDYNGYKFDFEGVAKELYRVTKEGGVVVWVVADRTVKGNESGTSFRQALHFKEIGFNLHDTMIYEKNGSAMRGSLKGYNQLFEYMFVFAKGTIGTYNIIRDKSNKTAGHSRLTSNRGKDGKVNIQGLCETENYTRRGNIWRYSTGYMQSSKDKIAFEHPAIFPEQLAEDHILSWSNPWDIVFDPMCGSGTTLKMALKNDRRYIGIDISKEYCEIAEKRIEDWRNELAKKTYL